MHVSFRTLSPKIVRPEQGGHGISAGNSRYEGVTYTFNFNKRVWL